MTQKNGYDTLDKTECKDIGEGGRGKDEGEGKGEEVGGGGGYKREGPKGGGTQNMQRLNPE